MNWYLKKFEALSNMELYNILKLRNQVFIVEQNCVYQDLDNIDQQSFHLFTSENENQINAYCRIIPPSISYKESSIGRVLCNPSKRNTGLGKLLMKKAIDHTFSLFPNYAIQIGAQCYLKKFYENLRFQQTSEIYLEDGIEHIKMILTR